MKKYLKLKLFQNCTKSDYILLKYSYFDFLKVRFYSILYFLKLFQKNLTIHTIVITQKV